MLAERQIRQNFYQALGTCVQIWDKSLARFHPQADEIRSGTPIRKKCENFDFSQIGQVRCANDAPFGAEQLCHRGQFIILLLKIENIIREMLHIDIDIFHRKNSIF